MQSAINAGNTNDTTLVTAEALREMTITKEALFERQKASILDSLMSTMVKVATENGGNNYVANLNPQFDTALLANITGELSKLGYNVATEAKSDSKMGPFISLIISW
jgi:hypothetical protein